MVAARGVHSASLSLVDPILLELQLSAFLCSRSLASSDFIVSYKVDMVLHSV